MYIFICNKWTSRFQRCENLQKCASEICVQYQRPTLYLCFPLICVYFVLEHCMYAVWSVKRCSFSALIVLPLIWIMSIRIGGLKIICFQNIKCYALVKISFANHIITGHLKFLVFSTFHCGFLKPFVAGYLVWSQENNICLLLYYIFNPQVTNVIYIWSTHS